MAKIPRPSTELAQTHPKNDGRSTPSRYDGNAFSQDIDFRDAAGRTPRARSPSPNEDAWDVFKQEDELLEPEPEPGDFCEEWDDDCQLDC